MQLKGEDIRYFRLHMSITHILFGRWLVLHFVTLKKKIQRPNNILQNMIFWIRCLQYGSVKDWSRNGTYNAASTNKYTDTHKHSLVHKKHCKRKPNKLLRQCSSGEPVFYTSGDANVKGVKLASGNLRITSLKKPWLEMCINLGSSVTTQTNMSRK